MTTTNNREKLLNKMRAVLVYTSFPAGFIARTPRSFKALMWGMPFLWVALLLSFSLALTAVTVGCLIGVVVYAITPSETWADRICKILKEYPPLDEKAYQSLLEKIEADTAERQDIILWLQAERRAENRLNRPISEQELIDSRLLDNGRQE